MFLKVYGSPSSAHTKRVATVLHEKNVPFQLIETDLMNDSHKKPEFCVHIDDDGFILYESRAICRYIAAKYPNQGPALGPTELKANALFEQAASLEVSYFEVLENIYKKYLKLTPDPAAFKKFVEKLDANLESYDLLLGKQKYLAGDEITLADLAHLPYDSMLALAGSDVISHKPNVDSTDESTGTWFKELQARPSWQAIQAGVKSTA